MRLRIFVSWSGERSRLLAESVVDWLPRVLQASAPWMSNQIEKGDRWSQRIGEQLGEDDIGVVCVTPENTTSPWLLFEAGALSKALDAAKVCPLLLGLRPSELEGPLAQFQATVVEKADLFDLVRTLNGQLADEMVREEVLRAAFRREWPTLERRIKRLTSAPIAPTVVTVPSVIRSFAKYGFPEPALGSSAYFNAGFESHGLYSTVCDVAAKRLTVFGRKNRKLFDKEHSDFFGELKAKVAAGFDFRCLFLDPAAPPHIISGAHQAADFSTQLDECIKCAHEMLSNAGLDPADHCRLYRTPRSTSMLVADDAVLYSPIKLTTDGRVRALTKCPFTVVNAQSPLGQELVDDLETAWSASRPF
jgi:hypothetical protein